MGMGRVAYGNGKLEPKTQTAPATIMPPMVPAFSTMLAMTAARFDVSTNIDGNAGASGRQNECSKKNGSRKGAVDDVHGASPPGR